MSDITHILTAIEQGDHAATDELLTVVYGELRSLAARLLARESPGQTLQGTAPGTGIQWRSTAPTGTFRDRYRLPDRLYDRSRQTKW